MFEKLSITYCDDLTIRDLIRLKDEGHPVFRSSHAGNWSLYKLLMSELGLPDCIWDVTCIYRDINNQPRHQLVDGQKISLLDEKVLQKHSKIKSLTPYHRVIGDNNNTLASFHMLPLKKLFGDSIITSQSKELLEYKESLQIVFEIVEKYKPESLGRYILPCGCMVTISTHASSKFWAECKHDKVEIGRFRLAESAIQTLEELNTLVWNPKGYEPKGGVLYSFELVVAAYYLWAYWKFGDKTIYELSGPDMAGYATKDDFVWKVEQVLKVVAKYAPERLFPKEIHAKIIPATVMRFGYPDNSLVAKKVMGAHESIRHIQMVKRKFKDVPDIVSLLNNSLEVAIGIVDEHRDSWNMFHDPAEDAFYSQHDMIKTGAKMIIQDSYLDMSFSTMSTILESLSQTEKSLRRSFNQKEIR